MKTGFACGVFDLFHPGHVLMLQECKAHCDYLLVAVNTAEHIDPVINAEKKKPVFTVEERAMILRACRYVDEVVTYSSEEELLQLMKTRKIDVRFLGQDYIGKPITGAELQIPIHYTDRGHGYSTTAIRKRIMDA